MQLTHSIIFHHPQPIIADGTSGSSIRPYEMLRAFEKLGYDVEVVVGYGAERKRAIRRIERDVRAGRHFAFMYSESSTMPTALTEPHHMPAYPLMDMRFFRWIAYQDIPIGLFYRDIYWRFPFYKNGVPSRLKRTGAIMFYRYDWSNYCKFVDHLFVPSLRMSKVLPTSWPSGRVSALPPGCTIMETPQQRKHSSVSIGDTGTLLKLFYVGGVTPPLYDVKPMIDAVKVVDGVELTLCCREPEWHEARDHYGCLDDSNIRVVHHHGEQISAHYFDSDIAIMFREAHPYLEFAVPVKLFEAVGYGMPIIVPAYTEMARIVSNEDMGWVVEDAQELERLLMYVSSHPEEIAMKRENVLRNQGKHTWLARACTVSNTLMKWRT